MEESYDLDMVAYAGPIIHSLCYYSNLIKASPTTFIFSILLVLKHLISRILKYANCGKY